MQTSAKGLTFIRTKEELRLKAYQDEAGVWTIGYGHTGPDVHEGLEITVDQARLLRDGMEILTGYLGNVVEGTDDEGEPVH